MIVAVSFTTWNGHSTSGIWYHAIVYSCGRSAYLRMIHRRLVRRVSSKPVELPLRDDPGQLAEIPSPSITLWTESISNGHIDIGFQLSDKSALHNVWRYCDLHQYSWQWTQLLQAAELAQFVIVVSCSWDDTCQLCKVNWYFSGTIAHTCISSRCDTERQKKNS